MSKTVYGTLYRTEKISPLKQAGSWQLQDFLVIVGKQGHAFTTTSTGLVAVRGSSLFPVEIVQMGNPYGIVSAQLRDELTPCYAAMTAIHEFFGANSDEAVEFAKHYACSDDQEDRPKQGFRMDDDLDGVQNKLPAWIKR